jgi:hypothetical protein
MEERWLDVRVVSFWPWRRRRVSGLFWELDVGFGMSGRKQRHDCDGSGSSCGKKRNRWSVRKSQARTSWGWVATREPMGLGPELVGRLVKMHREVADDPNVGFCGTMGIVSPLEFLQHLFP